MTLGYRVVQSHKEKKLSSVLLILHIFLKLKENSVFEPWRCQYANPCKMKITTCPSEQ